MRWMEMGEGVRGLMLGRPKIDPGTGTLAAVPSISLSSDCQEVEGPETFPWQVLLGLRLTSPVGALWPASSLQVWGKGSFEWETGLSEHFDDISGRGHSVAQPALTWDIHVVNICKYAVVLYDFQVLFFSR
jgi:hypothetical protein